MPAPRSTRRRVYFLTLAFTLIASALAAEWFVGTRIILHVPMSGDFKRESYWLEQYGQAACVTISAICIWQLDTARRKWAVPALILALLATSLAVTTIKATVARTRPAHDAPSLIAPNSHVSRHDSFPSGHSAAAVSLTVILANLYPRAKATFWTLASAVCALRYLNGAHWPSDIFAAVLLGWATATATLSLVASQLTRTGRNRNPPHRWKLAHT